MDASDRESVVLETSVGDIQLELYWEHAPKVKTVDTYSGVRFAQTGFQTCKNFAELARRGYYNGVIFHRIIAVRPFASQQTQ